MSESETPKQESLLENPLPPKTDKEVIKELQDRVQKLEELPQRVRSKFKGGLTIDEDVKQLKVPACIRTGMCCETILLLQSPRELREAYEAAVRRIEGRAALGFQTGTNWEDIHLIYPMLAGKCRGKYKWPSGNLQFVYGPCKNLTTEKVTFMKDGLEHQKEIASCSIHDHRPKLCSGYPDYGRAISMLMGPEAKPRSPGYMKGCGYNADPNEGNSPEQFVKSGLLPLEDNEK